MDLFLMEKEGRSVHVPFDLALGALVTIFRSTKLAQCYLP